MFEDSLDSTLPAPASRHLYFNKQVNQDSVGDLTAKILDINASDLWADKQFAAHGLYYTPPPIKIYIDSYGGSVYQCLGLIGVMGNSLTPIHTFVTGVAMSAGFMMAIHGHKRFAYPHATFMYHQISSAAWGKLADIQDQAEEACRLQKIFSEMIVARTRIKAVQLQDNFERKHDWYFNANDALTLGCVDVVVSTPTKRPLDSEF